MSDPETDQAVELSGSAAEIGTLWGKINAERIASDLRVHYLEPAEANSISREELLKRSGRFVELAERLAPHWLVEANGVAKAAGVDPDLYTSFVASVYRNLFAHPECTSYTVHKSYTKGNAVLFHKTRDNTEKSQCAFVMNSSEPNLNRFIAVSDASVVGCMMMVNEKGLAGSADMGGLTVDKPRYRGWMNTAVLRYIAEIAGTCEEALAIVEQFVKDGTYAGGDSTGTHWLFVDKTGTALEVSNNSDELVSVYHDEKAYFSRVPGCAAHQTLLEHESPIDFHAFHNVSRNPSICVPLSISGMTVEIDEQCPETMTCAWITLPAKSVAVPMFMGQRKTPRALLTGELYEAGNAAGPENTVWEEHEKAVYQSKRAVLEKARAIEAGGLTNLLDSWSLEQTESALVLLQSRGTK